MFSIHDAKVQHSASPNSRNVMNRHELASYCELFLHRPLFCPQIIKDFKTTEIKRKRVFMLYRVGRKRRRTQSLHTADIMRSPLRTLNAKGIQTLKNMKSLNLLNSVVQNYLRMLSNNIRVKVGWRFFIQPSPLETPVFIRVSGQKVKIEDFYIEFMISHLSTFYDE